jgi:hypothetical protein
VYILKTVSIVPVAVHSKCMALHFKD